MIRKLRPLFVLLPGLPKVTTIDTCNIVTLAAVAVEDS